MQSARTITLAFILFELLPMELRPSPNCASIVSILQLEKPSSCLHQSSYKYQPILGDMQSSRTVTPALMLFELLPLELCQSQNCVIIVSALYLENHSSYFHVTFYKYQSTLEDVQSARTITLAFTLFSSTARSAKELL